MLKRLAILAVLIPMASLIWVAFGQNAQKIGVVKGDGASNRQPEIEAQHKDQNPANAPSVVVQVETQSVDSKRTDGNDNDTDKGIARYTFWLMIFTAGLVVVGFLQFIVLHRQSELMGEHAAHLQAIAEIADKQTNHIAASERAWLTVAMGDAKLPLKDISNDYKVWFTPRITNCGRTVAHITKMYLRVRFSTVGEFEYPPRYEDEKDMPDDETCRCYGSRPFDENVLTVPNAIVMPVSVSMDGQKILESIENENLRLFLYGYVEYRTVGNPICITGFCLSYHIPKGNDPLEGLPDGWIIYGPGGYNYAK